MNGSILHKIISGGQTGVDRAALDVALELDRPCGGWCPKGRRAVDGMIPAKYPLQETESPDYVVRTRLNVLDSDGTLILNRGELSGGTQYTIDFAEKEGKPYLVMALDRSPNPQEVIDWITQNNIHILNVAGPREEGRPGIHSQAVGFLQKVL